MKTISSILVVGVIGSGVFGSLSAQVDAAPQNAGNDTPRVRHHKHSAARETKGGGIPAGTPTIWEDRGELTPSKVYWGAASLYPDPMSRLPAPPFSKFEKDAKPDAWSPKAKTTDSNGVKWTAKLGIEAKPDTVAPRLAWALGFGTVEGYYVPSGRFPGVDEHTDLGRAKGFLKPDGTFDDGARFKRHEKDYAPVKDAKDEDVFWDEGENPGVPPEQLSGLVIFDVLVCNWDAQRKNFLIYHEESPSGAKNWYIVNDMDACFAGPVKHRFDLNEYRKQKDYIKAVTGDTVEFRFADANRSAGRVHDQVPLAHAQWFRKQLAKLTDDEIQAAFDAAFATPALNRAYASGDNAQIKAAREQEIPPADRDKIAGFVAAFRARIGEFMEKIPAGS